MPSKIAALNGWAWKGLETSLLPLPPQERSLIKKISCYAVQAFLKLPFFAAVCTITTICHLVASRFSREAPKDHSLIAFAKRPEWTPPQPTDYAPVPIGFSTAGFQDDGPNALPNTNWGRFYSENPQGKKQTFAHVPDFWNNPDRFIEHLTATGATKFRFSIERARLQPNAGQPFDTASVKRYKEIILKFKQAGITPMITLVHFTDPTYFSWERESDIDGLVDYAAQACDLLVEAGITQMITINEPMVIATQSYAFPFGSFPPHKRFDFEGAANVLRNMMTAHNRIYEAVKRKHPSMEIGFCHDSVGFSSAHKWNPLFAPGEKLMCYFFNKMEQAFMGYLKTGQFELRVPFFANLSWQMEKPKMDFAALQYYCNRALVSFNPLWAGSVSRIPGEKPSAYQFRMYPQGLASALHDASSLRTPQNQPVPIEITEIGMDVAVNQDEKDSARIQYFERIFQVVRLALAHGVNIRSLYFWTLIRNIEWYRGRTVDFGFCDFNFDTGALNRRPVVDWITGQTERRKKHEPKGNEKSA